MLAGQSQSKGRSGFGVKVFAKLQYQIRATPTFQGVFWTQIFLHTRQNLDIVLSLGIGNQLLCFLHAHSVASNSHNAKMQSGSRDVLRNDRKSHRTVIKCLAQASVETEKEADPMEGKTPPQQTGTVSSPTGRPKRARRSRKPVEAEVKEKPSTQNQELPKRILTALVSILLPKLVNTCYSRIPETRRHYEPMRRFSLSIKTCFESTRDSGE